MNIEYRCKLRALKQGLDRGKFALMRVQDPANQIWLQALLVSIRNRHSRRRPPS